MKTLLITLAMAGSLLSSSLAMAGCPDGTCGGPPDDGNQGQMVILPDGN